MTAARAATLTLAAAAAGAGIGILPGLFAATGTLVLAAAGLLALTILLVRRTLELRTGTARTAPETDASGGRQPLTVARLLFYIGCLTVALATVRPTGGLTVSEIFFILAFGAAAFEVLRGRPIAAVPVGVLVGTFIFALGGAISSTQSANTAASLVETLHGSYVMLLWVWTGAMVLHTRRQFNVAVVLWVISAALDGAGALAQVAGVHALIGPADGNRMTGFTDHPNDLGGATAVALVPALAVATIAAGSGRRGLALIAWIPAVLIAAGLVLAASVAGLAAGLLGVVFWLSSPVVRAPTRAAIVALALVGVVVAMAAAGKIVSPATRIAQVTGSSAQHVGGGSGEDRLSIAKVVWQKIVERPVVGAGLDTGSATVHIVSAEGGASPYLTHGLPLAAWYEGGIFGLIGVVFVFVGLVRAAAVARDADEHVFGWGLCSAMVASTVYLLSAPMVFQQYAWLAAVMLVAWSVRRALVVSPAAALGAARSAGPSPARAATATGGRGQRDALV